MLEEIIVVSSWWLGGESERGPSHPIYYFQRGNNGDPRTISVTMGRPLITGELRQHANIGGPVVVTRGV